MSRDRTGVALGSRGGWIAVLEGEGPAAAMRALVSLGAGGPAPAGAGSPFSGFGRPGAAVSLPPGETEVLFLDRGPLTPREFDRSLPLEAERWGLPYAAAEAAFASEARRSPAREGLAVAVVRRSRLLAGLGRCDDLGLRTGPVVPDSLAWEALLRDGRAARPGRPVVLLEIGPGLSVVHGFDAGLRARARRPVRVGAGGPAEAALLGAELRRTLDHFEGLPGLGPVDRVLTASEGVPAGSAGEVAAAAGVAFEPVAPGIDPGPSAARPGPLPAGALRALGLALLRRPRLDLVPAGRRAAARAPAAGAAILLLGLLAAAALAAGAAGDRDAAADLRARARSAAERRAALEPRVRVAGERRDLEERTARLRERLRALAGARVPVPALLGAVEASGSGDLYLDRLTLQGGRLELRGNVLAADEGTARASLASYVGALEGRPVLANVAAGAKEAAAPDDSGATALPFVVTAAVPAEER